MNVAIVYTRTMTGLPIALAPTAYAGKGLRASVDVKATSGNGGNITLTGPDGNVPLVPGQVVWFDNIDLEKLTVNGTNGYTLEIVGNTVG